MKMGQTDWQKEKKKLWVGWFKVGRQGYSKQILYGCPGV